jgi:hypothetical protein
MISPPGCRRKVAISFARSPLATEDSGHGASWRVVEKTTLGISFIGAA